MQASEVTLQEVGKRYGEQWVVRGVDLLVQRGEFFTFLGPSGCGKTTLLRMIAGFIAPDEGIVYLDGEPVNHLPPWRRDLGMVFQNYALWPHLTVFENVAFGLRERRVAKAEIARRVLEAIRRVDLSGTENRRPSQLSGGQQQRVALARTLVIQPKVLLLDEPLSNLDAKLRAEMRLELLKLQRELGLTTIYVTHDQEEALAMSTRIAVMRDGHVVQQGSPRDIYEQPANEFVAAFVGKTNLFSGRVTRHANGLVEIQTEDGLRLRSGTGGSHGVLRPGAKAILSVRPEAVELRSAGEPGSTKNQLTGSVVASAYQGATVEYEIVARGRSLRAHVLNPKAKPVFHRGDEVTLVFAPEDVVLVHAEDGRAPVL